MVGPTRRSSDEVDLTATDLATTDLTATDLTATDLAAVGPTLEGSVS